MDPQDEITWNDLSPAERQALMAAYQLMIDALDNGEDG